MNANSQIAQCDLDTLAAKINSANNRMRSKFRDWILEVDGYLQEAKSQLKGADFLQWCESQLLWKKSRVYQIMDSAKVMQTLVDADMAGDFLPQSESWCRQLQRLPEELPEHWSKYLEQYADDQRTAATVKQYVDEVMGPKAVKYGDDVTATQGEVRRVSLLDGGGIIHASHNAQNAILGIHQRLGQQYFWTRDEANEGIDCQRERDHLANAYKLAAQAILHNEPVERYLEMIDDIAKQCPCRSYQPPATVTVDAVDVAPSVKGAKVTKRKKLKQIIKWPENRKFGFRFDASAPWEPIEEELIESAVEYIRQGAVDGVDPIGNPWTDWMVGVNVQDYMIDTFPDWFLKICDEQNYDDTNPKFLESNFYQEGRIEAMNRLHTLGVLELHPDDLANEELCDLEIRWRPAQAKEVV